MGLYKQLQYMNSIRRKKEDKLTTIMEECRMNML